MSEHQYLAIMRELMMDGNYREGRNGGTYSLFGRQMRFNLADGFPLLTTKRVRFKDIAVELLWFLRGDTNVQYLRDNGCTIWDEWADEDGNLGPIYGQQWREWNFGWTYTVDQISTVIESIRKDPYGRRHIVTAWNPSDVNCMNGQYDSPPPCHCLFQFYVANGKLSCHLYQRSADWFLGVPYNIASYALLTRLIARETGLNVGEFVHSFGDLHLYANHIEQAKEQVTRYPRVFPELLIRSEAGIFELQPSDFELISYDPHATIKAEVSK